MKLTCAILLARAASLTMSNPNGELFRARFNEREVTLTEIFPTYHAGLKIPDYIVDSHRKT